MTKRGKRSSEKKKRKVPVYPGGLVIPPDSGEYVMKSTSTDSGEYGMKRKAIGSTSTGSGEIGRKRKAIGSTSGGAGKDSDGSGSESSDSKPPEELFSIQSIVEDSHLIEKKKLPKCPTPMRMFVWTVDDYKRYDEFLIEKWKIKRFEDHETTYMSIRDPNCRLASVYRYLYNLRH